MTESSFWKETAEHTPHQEWVDLCKMDGLVSGQFDSLLQINREQSESSFVPLNMLLVYALVLTQVTIIHKSTTVANWQLATQQRGQFSQVEGQQTIHCKNKVLRQQSIWLLQLCDYLQYQSFMNAGLEKELSYNCLFMVYLQVMLIFLHVPRYKPPGLDRL